jgi:hypothetical protein
MFIDFSVIGFSPFMFVLYGFRFQAIGNNPVTGIFLPGKSSA